MSTRNGAMRATAEEGAAERRRDEVDRREADLLAGRGMRELRRGNDGAERSELRDVEEQRQRSLHERDERDLREESSWSAIATTRLVHGADVHDVRNDHQALAVQAVDGGSCERSRRATHGEARAKPTMPASAGECVSREDEQGVRDPGRLGADRGERLPDLQQDEVAVLAERYELAQAASATSTSRNLPPPRQQIRRGEQDGGRHDHDLDPVVDQGDERCSKCDRDRLRHAEQHVRSCGHPTLQVARAAPLIGGRDRDHRPDQPDARDCGGARDRADVRHEQEAVGERRRRRCRCPRAARRRTASGAARR